ncbi:fimbrial protein [Cronobacter dublinensis]|uniref:fimbrial protein n=1 Tax=Cronobacter dublinensis TaxID=413497 RepID=UPI002938A7EE|nr:fimbrial protein [Cronobacter dublinensis]ELQ5996136.1 fimbrial protein [Cronobacter dublinensis]ELY2737849.1 fimbrial protein [Cronobacter dublinensis]
MKKRLLVFLLSSLFTAGMLHAEDNIATLQINGNVSNNNYDCYIYVDDTISLTGQTDQLIAQGDNATAPQSVSMVVGNVSGYCPAPERTVIQLHATADSANGTVIANSDLSENGAKGVGIGVYDKNKIPVSINGGIIPLNGLLSTEVNFQLVKLNGQTPTEGSIHGVLTLDLVRL